MKRALGWTLGLTAIAALALAASGWVVYTRAQVSTVGELTFENELAVPPLLEPKVKNGRKVFQLTLQQGRTALLPDKPTQTGGVNGTYLGPTLRVERRDQVEVRVQNELPEATTIHWHGMHLPAIADGGPHQPIEPGKTWTPSWTIRPTGSDALVPPASARADGRPCLPRHRRTLPARRRAFPPSSAAARLRPRRHPAHHPGQAAARGRLARLLAGLDQPHRSPREHHPRQRHLRPAP